MTVLLVVALAAAGAAAAQTVVPPIRSSSAPIRSDAEEAQALRIAEDARRALAELAAGQDSGSPDVTRARDVLRQAEDSLRAGNFSAATALFREALSTSQRSKAAKDRVAGSAKAARGKAQGAIGNLPVSSSAPPGSAAAKFGQLAVMKFLEADEALRNGRHAEALRLFESAENFARRVRMGASSGQDTCSAARDNYSRVWDFQSRAERAIPRISDTVAWQLVLRARALLEDARRQMESGVCEESLRNSRLAENLLKQAGKAALSSIR